MCKLLALLLVSSCTAGTATALSTAATGSQLICAAMLSFNRPHYLVPSVRSFISYMTAVEPDIPWTLQILDNGSGPEALANITEELAPLRHLDRIRLVHLEQGVGLSRGFNLLFFDMCASTGAPYLLSLEDDWQARSNDWPAAVPIMRAAMQLLQRHDRLLEVWLRDSSADFPMHLNASWQEQQVMLAGSPDPRVPISSTTNRRHGRQRAQQQQQQTIVLQALVLTCDPASHPWGGYTNGASLKQFDRLQQLGRMPHVDGEADWSAKACQDGWHVAYICKDTSCYEPNKQWHSGLFEHIGVSRVPEDQDVRFSPTVAAAAASVPASCASETLKDLKHQELMSVSVQHMRHMILVTAKWQRQARRAGGPVAGDNGSSASWGAGVVLFAAAATAAVCAGICYGRKHVMGMVGSKSYVELIG